MGYRADPFEKADRHSHSLLRPKPFRMSQGQKTRTAKTVGIISALLFFFYLFSAKTPVTSDTPANVPAVSGVRANAASPSDQNIRCAKPYDPHKPLIQYALMIDAGSTGSRIHVYRFNNCGPTPELESEEFKMTEPKKGGSGLSSYKNDPEGAAQSLDILMDVALKTVPDEYRSCSPIAVKATAGLRMVGQEIADKILDAVRYRLETVYPFPVVSKEKGGVQIMDGKDEGVYAWVTTNYLLGKIGSAEKTPTVAVFDLGGGSTQIVFEPTFRSKDGSPTPGLADGDHKYNLKFGGREFTLYQHSHLGYGLMEARQSIHRAIIEAKHHGSPGDSTWLKEPIVNPCIVPGLSTNVSVSLPKDHPLGSVVSVTMTGPKEVGSPAQCRAVVDKILNKEQTCPLRPCSFNGVHQPPIETTFPHEEDIYIFSYFYDRVAPLGMPDKFTLRELHDLTATVCAGESNWGVFYSIEKAMDELKGRGEYCLDLNFMLGLLHSGYEMPLHREVKIAKKISGNELGWCLGAR